jgi:cysteine desulfurase
MKNRIYLDNNATTGIDARVLDAMLAELSSLPSNSSSPHYFGQQAKQRLQQARESIASFLHVRSHEILFTSGGTESLNMLVRGALQNAKNAHVITTNVEHSCIYNTLMALSASGIEVSFLPAGLLGAVHAEDIRAAIQPNTRLIIVSAVNSETGVKHDMEAIAHVAYAAKIPFIVDGVALLGKEFFTIPQGVSAMGFSAHKFHGPKGAGFAFLRSSFKIQPLLTGGDQEFGLRAGTENLPGIIGMAKAIELLHSELPSATHRMALLRDKLESGLLVHANPVIVHGMGPRVANTCNLSFPETQGEDLLIALDMAGIAVSHGSACTSGALEPSRVLTNMGIPHHIARSAIRFSLSRNTTEKEIDTCIEQVSRIVERLRK